MDYRRIGHIIKPHGVVGKMKVRLSADAPSNCLEHDLLWLQPQAAHGSMRSYQVAAFSATTPGFGLLLLKEVHNRDVAETLRDCVIHIPRSADEPLTESAEGLASLVGYTLYVAGNCVGIINTFHAFQGNPLLGVQNTAGKEHLVPAQEHFIVRIDHSTRHVHMQLPEGLLELS